MRTTSTKTPGVDSDALFIADSLVADPDREAFAARMRGGVSVEATDLARGPWDRSALHGGPVSAMLAFGIESQDVGRSFVVARLTVELERVVPPHRELTLCAEVIRPGRKVQLAESLLRLDGKVVARARALFIRQQHITLPDDPIVRPEPAPVSEGVLQTPSVAYTESYAAFHNAACEHRFVEGSWIEHGPVFVWVRMKYPLIAGLALSPLQRVAAAADFGNGVSSVVPSENISFINPDLTVHQHRPLRGEWVGMRAKSHVDSGGVGFAESELFDRSGRFGRSLQSLLLEQRGDGGE